MEWKVIKTNVQYIDALKRLVLIMDASPGTAESKEATLLLELLKKYERSHAILPEPDLMHL